MVFTVQKLRTSLKQLRYAIEGTAHVLTPVYSSVATGPMAMPTAETQWQPLEVGQQWGVRHGTSWLMTTLEISGEMQGQHSQYPQQLVLQLHWEAGDDGNEQTTPRDELYLVLEATAFLDGQAIGGFDWRHRALVLPEKVRDGQRHTLQVQVYTGKPQPFGGLTLHVRHPFLWQTYYLMDTLLNVSLTMQEDNIARHSLLQHLNTAYTMLDLREGWQSERLIASAQTAYDYLQSYRATLHSDEDQPHISVTGHAHLDVAWYWPYWRTRQKIAHTVSNGLHLMERYPDFHYSQSQPQVLQWLKEDVPEVYERVKQRVAEGRFELVGAMWLEADCNIPSGESLVRQILYGTRFLQEEFGVRPRHIWLPDVFGYSAALPQIMRGCDIPVFMTTKISWNQFNRMPCDTFRWRGIDGTEVLTHFVTAPELQPTTRYYTYNGPVRATDMVGTWTNYRQQDINTHLLYLAGWGDGGGGPTEEQLERVQVMADLPAFPQVHTGRADTFFTSLYERVWDNPHLPRWVGELYLEYHRGTYTSQARTKQANRRAEQLYRETEFLNAWASLYGMPSRQERLGDGWRIILLNQFHDVLPGSSIGEVYEDATRLYIQARSIAQEIRDEALTTIQQQVASQPQDLLLFNTLPWERTDPVQLPATFTLDGGQGTIDWDSNEMVLLDSVRVPSSGVASLSAARASVGKEEYRNCQVSRLQDGTLLLQNSYYDLYLNSQGEISRLYDKQAKREVLATGETGNQLIAYEDRPLNFDAWDIDLFYEEKPYPLREVSSLRILEEGPVRVTVEIVRPYLSSRVTQRLSLWRTSPRIDIATEIDWHEHQTLLKAAFPLALNSTRATYEIQFGSVERPTHRNTSWDMARFEVCAHRWIDVSEGGYGVSLLNDSKYGHDVHDNVMRITLLKSGVVPDPQADQGLHRFTYSLLPHTGDWHEGQSVRRAYELNAPLFALASLPQPATSAIQQSASFVQTACSHIVVETIKPAEDGNGLIVRLYEAHNQRGPCTLTFIAPIHKAQSCNLLEEPLEAGNTDDVMIEGHNLSFSVRPFEIKTFRVWLRTGEQ